MNDCVFCRIVSKNIPSTIVFETDAVLGIVPKNQVSEGHALLLPKKHFQNIFDIEDELLQKIISAAKILSNTLVEKYKATGINILHASGRDAQQSVFHFHLHIVPRYPNDGLDLWIREGL